jgi:hypothetical protein
VEKRVGWSGKAITSRVNEVILAFLPQITSMSERPKETDLSPVAEMRVGSNPTARIVLF